MNSFARALTGLTALAGAAAFAPVAQAANYNAGVLSGTGTIAESVTVSGSFTDYIDFSISGQKLETTSIGSVLTLSPPFDSIVLSTTTINSVVIKDISTNQYISGVASGSAIVYSGLSAADTYQFIVNGIVSGIAAGGYGIKYSVSAVPLPGALVLFGSGIVALGAVARRKMRNSAR